MAELPMPTLMAPPPLLRSSGLLLHVTSLPTPFGIGDLGPAAREWVDLLAAAGQTWWQVLPLGPPAGGASPYQCFSAFAGNPLLISPEELRVEGLVEKGEVAAGRERAWRAGEPVDYARVEAFKRGLLRVAAERFYARRGRELGDAFDAFCRREKHWLEDYALFMALREALGGKGWAAWPRELAGRRKEALAEARRRFAGAIAAQRFEQFVFFRQLQALRDHARGRGVKLIGDLPIFVALESADAWAHPHLFTLDARGRPVKVAGVPPDAFSETGQRWGNPLYDWRAMEREGFAWWVRRLRASLEQADLVRIDHFRGFAACWEIPARARTAKRGQWVCTPGEPLLLTLRKELGGTLGALPVIAEDLGLITPDVDALRRQFRLPGMRVLQFAFGGDAHNPHLPHNIEPDSVAYTGTHDNDTTVGWYRSADAGTRKNARRYFPAIAEEPAWTLLEATWGTVARVAIAPLQDLLSLGNEARMNLPGTAKGNWGWRAPGFGEMRAAFRRLRGLTEKYGRAAGRDGD
jgi:4-alpha-glucanotransferase